LREKERRRREMVIKIAYSGVERRMERS